MARFEIFEAGEADFPGLFVIMRLLEPTLSVARWLRYARSLSGGRAGRSGILVAARSRGSAGSGLLCFRVREDLLGGRVMLVEHLVVLDLLRPDEMIAELLRALEPVAERAGCVAIRSVAGAQQSDLLAHLQRDGHRVFGFLFDRRSDIAKRTAGLTEIKSRAGQVS